MNDDNMNLHQDFSEANEENNFTSQENNRNNNEYENYDTYTSTEGTKKLHIPRGVILFLVGMIVLDIICMIRFPKVLSDYKLYMTAERRINNGETSQVLEEMNTLVEKHPASTPIIMKCIRLSMEQGYYESAAYLFNTYLTGRKLSDSEYSQVDQYNERLNEYYTTYDSVDKIFSEVKDLDTVDDKKLAEMKKSLMALLEEDGQDYAYVYYSLAQIEADVSTVKEYMQKCYDNNPECFDARVQLSVLYRRSGDYETAEKYCREALAKDRMDSGALRSMAIIKMLKGDLASGLNFAEESYQSDPDGNYVRETYLIALTMNQKMTEAKGIEEEMQKANVTLDDQTKQLLNNTITLKEYYVEE